MPKSEITLTRQEFYDAIWKTPACHLCKAWNITFTAFVNICDEFNIPRPTPDYWPLVRLNRPYERIPLSPATVEMPSLINLSLAARKKRVLQPLIQSEKLVATETSKKERPLHEPDSPSPIRVAQDFKKAHSLIRASKALLASQTPDKYSRVKPWPREKCVNVSVTKTLLNRALLIMDAVLRELAARGHKPDFKENRGEFEFGIRVGQELVRIKMSESTVRRERTLSAEEAARDYVWDVHIFEPTGVLTFCIDEFWGPPHRSWSETGSVKLEEKLAEIVDAVIVTGNLLHAREIARREEERLAAERRQREFELQQIWEKERRRREDLLKQSELWDKIDRLRSFLASCEARLANRNELGSDSAGSRWLSWARRYADEIDPLNGEYLTKALAAHPEEQVKVIQPTES